MMAMLDATKHSGLRNQTLFMGYSGQKYSEYVSSAVCAFEAFILAEELWDLYFPNMEHHEGIVMEYFSMFISPWASTREDELFFRNTCSEVAQVL